MNKIKKITQQTLRSLPLYVSALFPLVVHGADAIQPFVDIACRVMYYVWVLAIAVGVIYILIAAFKYMSAGGDASKVSEAHQTVLYAIIGLVVAMVAGGVPNIIASVVGGAAPDSCK